MMLAGDLTWTLGVFGNAAFTMVMLQLMLASHGRWSLVAVWHAMLNATGGLFFFAMVVGDDRARLGLLLSSGYAVLAVVVHFAGGRNLEWRDDLARSEARASASGAPHFNVSHTCADECRVAAGSRKGRRVSSTPTPRSGQIHSPRKSG